MPGLVWIRYEAGRPCGRVWFLQDTRQDGVQWGLFGQDMHKVEEHPPLGLVSIKHELTDL